MKYLLSILLIILIIGYYFYNKALQFFKSLQVSYTIALIGNKTPIIAIRVFNPTSIQLKINNPEIRVYDGNSNLLIRLVLFDSDKNAILITGENIFNFTIVERLQFTSPINLNQTKTFFSASIYGIKFNKQIPTNIN